MDDVARWVIERPDDLRDLVAITADELGLDPVIVEKDLWVCWMLRRLFTDSQLGEHLIFKGGTSLSKCFDLIARFSEDIDLILDYRALGELPDPFASYSRTRQREVNQAILHRAQDYLSDRFVPRLREVIASHLSTQGWSLSIDAERPGTVRFRYPSVLAADLAYIRKAILLEIGPHAARVPHQNATVSPFVAKIMPDQFVSAGSTVRVIDARRSFWEKVTILHENAHRPRDNRMPTGYSRHYSDAVAMSQRTELLEGCLADFQLLDAVIAHKQRFYHRGWAGLDTARPPTLQLLPSDAHLQQLRQDYAAMRPMFMAAPPAWDALIDELERLARRINACAT